MKFFMAFFLFCPLAFASLPLSVETCFKELKAGKPEEYHPKHAKLFHSYKQGSWTIVQIQNEFFFLSPEEDKHCLNLTHIKIPIKNIITFSTTHLSYLNLLGKDELVVGISGQDYLNNELVKKRLSEGKVKDIQYPPSEELLLSLHPQGIFSYGVHKADQEKNERMKKLGLPLIPVFEYQEASPLARAEWLVFFSLFFGEENKAQKIFNEKEKSYLELRQKIQKRQSVLAGELKNGLWYAPDSQSDFIKLIKEAGGDYLLEGQKNVSYEKVLELLQKRKEKVLWFPQNLWTSLADVKKASPYYEKLGLLEKVEIYNNNAKRNAKGYSEYWESALTHPDLLLKDVVKILHPELLKDHKLKWYEKLK